MLVSMADAWKNRKVEDVAAKPVRPHDWTFSTCFNGSTGATSGEVSAGSSKVSTVSFAPFSLGWFTVVETQVILGVN